MPGLSAPRPPDLDARFRLLWSALQAGIAALASQASARLARWIWIRVFGETPPGH